MAHRRGITLKYALPPKPVCPSKFESQVHGGEGRNRETRDRGSESISGSQLVDSHMPKLCHIAYDGTTRPPHVPKSSVDTCKEYTNGQLLFFFGTFLLTRIIETFLLEIGVVFLIPENVSFDPPRFKPPRFTLSLSKWE